MVEDVKTLTLRREGVCGCGAVVPAGTRAGWSRSRRVVICVPCMERPAPVTSSAPVDVGLPGGSLQRAYERRVAAREAKVLARHPRIGRLLLRWSGEAPTTTVFARGAEGERDVADRLQNRFGGDVLFLWNRRLGPDVRGGDVDVVAVSAHGVVVIDPKNYRGRRVRATRDGDTFVVDGRRRPGLSASMRRQLDAVREAVAAGPRPSTPVDAAYCFLGADLPWRALSVDGVPALGIRGTIAMLEQPGPLGPEERDAVHRDLAMRLPPA